LLVDGLAFDLPSLGLGFRLLESKRVVHDEDCSGDMLASICFYTTKYDVFLHSKAGEVTNWCTSSRPTLGEVAVTRSYVRKT
jgi:hypothetical protein